MKPEFICANHRQWLQERPTEAYNWWEKSFDTGKHYQEMHEWNESVRPLGCAFDAATICMEQSHIIESDVIDLFSRTAQCLTYSLLKVGQRGFAQQIVSAVQVLLANLEGHVFDRQKMVDMQRKLHLFLAAHPAVSQEHSKGRRANVQSLLSYEKVVSIH